MKNYFVKTPRILRRYFSRYIWCFSAKTKEIYLTFDDGPTPKITNFVLSELKKYNAKATFFCIGKNIQQYPSIFTSIILDGHSIGNHTQNHLNGYKCSTKRYLENFEECHTTIAKYNPLPNSQKLFRPPYGKITRPQASKIIKKGYKIIMWDVLSADFDPNSSKERCLQNVLQSTNNGSILIFHDSVKAAQKVRFVLPKILKEFTDKGFTFKAIAAL